MKNTTTQQDAVRQALNAAETPVNAGIRARRSPDTVNSRKGLVAAAVLSLLTAAGCGAEFSSGNTNTDAGTGGTAGSGGHGGETAGGTGGTGGAGLDGGAGGTGGTAGSGAEGGAGGGPCQDLPVILTGMAEDDYKVFRGGCGPGNVIANTFVDGNTTFENTPSSLCLLPGDKIILQVKDSADLNSAEFHAPEESVQAVGVNILVSSDPISNSSVDTLCNNPGMFVTYDPAADDKNPVSGQYKFEGNNDGDGGLPLSNVFYIQY